MKMNPTRVGHGVAPSPDIPLLRADGVTLSQASPEFQRVVAREEGEGLERRLESVRRAVSTEQSRQILRNVADAITTGNWNSSVLWDEPLLPDYSLALLYAGTIKEDQFATLQRFWARREECRERGVPLRVIPLFNGGQVDLVACELIWRSLAETMSETKLMARSPRGTWLSDAELTQFFCEAKNLSPSEQVLFVWKDLDFYKTWLAEARCNLTIAQRLPQTGARVLTSPGDPDHPTRIDAGIGMLELMRRIRYGDAAFRGRYVTSVSGQSPVEAILEGSLLRERDQYVPMPGDVLPTHTDLLLTGTPGDFADHDQYHANVASCFPSRAIEAFQCVGRALMEREGASDVQSQYDHAVLDTLLDLDGGAYQYLGKICQQDDLAAATFWLAVLDSTADRPAPFVAQMVFTAAKGDSALMRVLNSIGSSSIRERLLSLIVFLEIMEPPPESIDQALFEEFDRRCHDLTMSSDERERHRQRTLLYVQNIVQNLKSLRSEMSHLRLLLPQEGASPQLKEALLRVIAEIAQSRHQHGVFPTPELENLIGQPVLQTLPDLQKGALLRYMTGKNIECNKEMVERLWPTSSPAQRIAALIDGGCSSLVPLLLEADDFQPQALSTLHEALALDRQDVVQRIHIELYTQDLMPFLRTLDPILQQRFFLAYLPQNGEHMQTAVQSLASGLWGNEGHETRAGALIAALSVVKDVEMTRDLLRGLFPGLEQRHLLELLGQQEGVDSLPEEEKLQLIKALLSMAAFKDDHGWGVFLQRLWPDRNPEQILESLLSLGRYCHPSLIRMIVESVGHQSRTAMLELLKGRVGAVAWAGLLPAPIEGLSDQQMRAAAFLARQGGRASDRSSIARALAGGLTAAQHLRRSIDG